jgi:CRP-like cAMP-binding protein
LDKATGQIMSISCLKVGLGVTKFYNGDRQIMAYLIPGDLCDIHVTLLDVMDHSIGALSACKILTFPRADLADLMLENPQILRAYRAK